MRNCLRIHHLFTPLNNPLDLASFNNVLRAYAIIKNRKGERRNPWRRPLKALKKCEGEMFIRMERDALWRQPMI
jgi:hypothetical protein